MAQYLGLPEFEERCFICQQICIDTSKAFAYRPNVQPEHHLLYHQCACDDIARTDDLLVNDIIDYLRRDKTDSQGRSRRIFLEHESKGYDMPEKVKAWDKLSSLGYIYHTYQNDLWKFASYHKDGEDFPLCPHCRHWTREDWSGDPRDHIEFHKAFCFPNSCVGNCILPDDNKFTPIEMNAVCDVLTQVSRNALVVDDGMARSDVFKQLLIQPGDMQKLNQVPQILTQDSPGKDDDQPDFQSDEWDPHSDPNLQMTIVKWDRQDEADKVKKKLKLNTSKEAITAVLDMLEYLGYVHVYMINGIDYVFIPHKKRLILHFLI